VRHDGLREIQHPGQIDVDDAPPAGLVDVHELHRLGDSGVVDENVDLAESINGFRGRSLARGQIGDIASEPEMVRTQALRRCFRGPLIDIEDRNARALLGEQSRGREADPTRPGGSRDDCSLTAQKHGFLPKVWAEALSKAACELKRELYND
jgi:hypothetical protein